MNNLKTALNELDGEWFASLPNIEDIPQFEVSRKFERWEQRIIYGKKSVSSKVVKVILIAAALLILFSVVSLSTTKGREFVMQFFKESAVYSILAEQSKEVNTLTVNYLPEGFELDDSFENDLMIYYYYTNNEVYFEIKKNSINTTVDFNYNENAYEQIEYNDILYTVVYVNKKICNIIWNYHDYFYQVSGTIDKETALQIAFGIE